eukprot:1157902-Pelagomonas_calceolata.AAC.18
MEPQKQWSCAQHMGRWHRRSACSVGHHLKPLSLHKEVGCRAFTAPMRWATMMNRNQRWHVALYSPLSLIVISGVPPVCPCNAGASAWRVHEGKLVSAMMKKHLVESVIPLLIELKHMLQVCVGWGGQSHIVVPPPCALVPSAVHALDDRAIAAVAGWQCHSLL